MAINGSPLRMGGLSSGLDTEAIVEAMTASTKLRITTEQRKVLKLEAQQEAYRDIITDVTAFKNKYFDILKGDSCLSSKSLFNQYKATTSVNGVEGEPSGVSVSTNATATAANYQVKVHEAATQTTVTSKSLNSSKSIDFDKYTDGSTYSLKITEGKNSKIVSFSGRDADEVKASLNEALKDAFGKKNDGTGRVQVDDTGVIASSDKSSLSIGDPVHMSQDGHVIDFGTGEAGTNSITITVGDQTQTFNFMTIPDGYFDGLFETDPSTGKVALDENGMAKFRDLNESDYATEEEYKAAVAENKNKRSVFEDLVKEGMYVNDYEDQYQDWSKSYGAGANNNEKTWGDYDQLTAEQQKLVQSYAKYVNDDNAEKLFDAALKNEYETDYKQYLKEVPKDQTAMTMREWAASKDSKITLENFRNGTLGATKDDGEFGKQYENLQKRLNLTDPSSDPDQFKRDMNSLMGLGNSEAKMFGKLYENGYKDEINQLSGVSFKDPTDFYNAAANNLPDAIDSFNENSLLPLKNLTFGENKDIKLDFSFANRNVNGGQTNVTITAYTEDEAGNRTNVEIGVQANSNSKNTMGLTSTDTAVSTVAGNTKLSELGTGLSSYEFTINGVDFKFDGDKTVREMMNAVNGSSAGVYMKLNSLTNTFEISSSEYGTGGTVSITDKVSDADTANGATGLFSRLGFDTNDLESQTTVGRNMIIEVNGHMIETASNSYEVDGTTFTIDSTVKAGTEFETGVKRDHTNAIKAIKEFVTDYNNLIQKVFGYTDEKPNKDYYFLTDSDREDLELSESQEEKWEKVAKQGILYNDSVLTGMMSKFRTVLYGSVENGDGTAFGLYNMGITTSSDYALHGQLQLNEAELAEAFEKNADKIANLFADTENGIMTQFKTLTESYVKTSSARESMGLLVAKAGTASGGSTKNNAIYDQIKRINSGISSLEKRFKKQEDRYWSIFSALETQMSQLNSQSSYVTNMFGM